jgi:hypothetical protein
MKGSLLVLLLSAPMFAQSQQRSTGKATTAGECSPAVTGTNNNFKFNDCGIGKAQAEQIIGLLNKRLGKGSPDEVINKLNELLKRTNPNGTVITYDCAGDERVSTPSTGRISDHTIQPGELTSPLLRLLRTGKYSELLAACKAHIDSEPEWLTSRLFCAAAYISLGNRADAQKMFDEYNAGVGDAYNAPLCLALASEIRTRLH